MSEPAADLEERVAVLERLVAQLAAALSRALAPEEPADDDGDQP